MNQTAQLRSDIRSRKFEVLEIIPEIGRRVDEIRTLMGTSLKKDFEISFRLVAQLASEVAALQEKQAKLNAEIERGEKELNG